MQESTKSQIIASLFREYAPSLKIAVLSKTGCEAAADDIIQEVFIKLLRCGDLTDIRSVKSYLYRISMNATVDYFRSSKRRAAMVDENPVAEVNAKAENPSAEELLIFRDSIVHLYDRVGKISPLCQRIFWLSRGDGYRNSEIAQMLNVCVSTVEKNISKASRCCQTA